MRNEESWAPSKYELHAGRVRASRDPSQISVSSRLITDLVGEVYTRMIPKYSKGHLLDLGCGHAPLYLLYRDHAEEVTCMDWAESLHQNQFLDHVHDLTKPFPLADEQFDTVLCSDVLEHISEPMHVWKEVHRVLKPGGRLLMNMPFLYHIHEEPHDFHRYTEFALKHYASGAGFELEELCGVGGVWQVLGDITAKLLQNYTRTTLPSRIVQKLASPSCQKTVDKSLRRIGTNRWPLLYFLVARKAG